MRAVYHSGAGATFSNMVQYVPIRLHTKRIKKADHVFAAVRIGILLHGLITVHTAKGERIKR